MDEKDKLLLSLLRRDARRPVVALARDLNLSRTATQDRLARLQASGAIAGFTVVEGGQSAARESAYLIVRFAPGKRCAQVVPKLKAIPAITLIHSVTGPVDLIVRIEAENVAGIEAARAALDALPEIAELSTYVVLERHLG
jgi:DNA-binding Lrp family transcriptional regulator